MTAPAADRLTALVTGASAGIGAALAREFAGGGFDLVLVARREDRLRALGAGLETEFGIRAHVLAADLARPEAPAEIFEALAERGLQVDALVNNAGYGVPGELTEVDWARHRDCLQVMVTAPVHLAWLAAPGMARRGRGYILNVSSLAALLPPHAGGTLYYPVKAFVLKFSLAQAAELGRAGVHVTALCPGFTRTEFQEASGGTVEKVEFPEFMWMDAAAVARRGFRAVMRGDPVCVPGFANRFLAAVFKFLPDRLGRWLVRVTG